ncbi:response regulator [Croceicoccus hydrothermalis]|uniref:response regulator n=1 Tax=Croceicoccus hydrothermalis TaxID=2867964 RepID=UPI001EFBEEF6|nr:response regulator [Croceicoccus hydrothermalis]
MSTARVLIVDDSTAMRALFRDILEQAKGVEVVGDARSAEEARKLIPTLKPNVLTLDVEMPGMSGMEFLAELMENDPIPVIMLSSVTQDGTGTAQKALELGAVGCFPKPLHTTPEQFNATVAKLGAIVNEAANTDLKNREAPQGGPSVALADYRPDGRIVVLAGATESIEVIRETIAGYPANCPETVILIDADETFIDRMIDPLRPSVACKIETAGDETMMVPGTVYLVYAKHKHVVFENDFAPLLKLVEKDPIGGARPSADMLFASFARAGTPVLAGLLSGTSKDGARGLQALSKSGADVFVQDCVETGSESRKPALDELGVTAESVTAANVPNWILGKTKEKAKAA